MPKANKSIFDALLRKCAMEGAMNPKMIRGTKRNDLSRNVFYANDGFQHSVVYDETCRQSDNYGNKQLHDGVT